MTRERLDNIMRPICITAGIYCWADLLANHRWGFLGASVFGAAFLSWLNWPKKK